jgi:hypothetical protein
LGRVHFELGRHTLTLESFAVACFVPTLFILDRKVLVEKILAVRGIVASGVLVRDAPATSFLIWSGQP